LLKSRGLLAKPTHVNIIRLAPPLCITEAELDQSIDIIASCLKDITSMKKEDVPNALGV
jgi:ornithine--oxo-acid transaminase